ncbi:HD domain-containing protein [Actinomarinicola tropica]|uniref:HD domain-containing protein n=1 Tax=Actinomarinicola tropica TaxID=2789776 RepID=A0A5Q2RNX0_9ACTN|nr:HD domain-containing protein [Actinomarinicola tropica]
MHGHDAGSVRRAHDDTRATIEPQALLDRAAREAHEDAWLTPGATRAVGAGRRADEEEPDRTRTCFERDRDRILHGTTAFRRLAGKTQVFIFPEDHQRTRLTHALEVAQVATSIARALRLNVALAEAIALGHDCGHGPGGHASEDAFTPYVAEGYDHAVWGADVVLAPLNLCAETLDGIRNHSWSRPAPSTPEGEVVSWADRIAYVCHDVEDAVHVGIVRAEDLPGVVRDRCGTTRREQLHTFISAVVDASLRSGTIGMDADTADALAAFRRFNYERIYMRPASVAQGDQVVRVLRALVEHYADAPHALPADQQAADLTAGSTDALRAAVTYVGGMTDRYAFGHAISELGWDPADLPRGIDWRG